MRQVFVSFAAVQPAHELFGDEVEHPLKFRAMDFDLISYQFSRQKVERRDFTHFLDFYALEKLPTNRRLRDLMNRFVFCIEGWDDDQREIHTIQEIRRFYSAFHEAWPYWFYFCNLENDTLRAITMCCLTSHCAIGSFAGVARFAWQRKRSCRQASLCQCCESGRSVLKEFSIVPILPMIR